MGRPKTSSTVSSPARQATVERLVDAAMRVIAEKGYGDTTVQDIASAAGLTTGAIYANFTSKDELIRRMVEEDGRRSPGGDSAPETLRALVDDAAQEATRHGLEDRAATRFWMEVLARSLSEPELHDQVRASTRQTMASLTKSIDAIMEIEGRESPLSAAELARVFRGLGWGLTVIGLFDAKLASAKTRERLILAVLEALTPPAGD